MKFGKRSKFEQIKSFFKEIWGEGVENEKNSGRKSSWEEGKFTSEDDYRVAVCVVTWIALCMSDV